MRGPPNTPSRRWIHLLSPSAWSGTSIYTYNNAVSQFVTPPATPRDHTSYPAYPLLHHKTQAIHFRQPCASSTRQDTSVGTRTDRLSRATTRNRPLTRRGAALITTRTSATGPIAETPVQYLRRSVEMPLIQRNSNRLTAHKTESTDPIIEKEGNGDYRAQSSKLGMQLQETFRVWDGEWSKRCYALPRLHPVSTMHSFMIHSTSATSFTFAFIQFIPSFIFFFFTHSLVTARRGMATFSLLHSYSRYFLGRTLEFCGRISFLETALALADEPPRRTRQCHEERITNGWEMDWRYHLVSCPATSAVYATSRVPFPLHFFFLCLFRFDHLHFFLTILYSTMLRWFLFHFPFSRFTYFHLSIYLFCLL